MIKAAYLKELEKLSGNGATLFYPYDKVSSPRYIAERMSGDRYATYMRDVECDEEGRLKIHFSRVSVKK